MPVQTPGQSHDAGICGYLSTRYSMNASMKTNTSNSRKMMRNVQSARLGNDENDC